MAQIIAAATISIGALQGKYQSTLATMFSPIG
jgi:hypothetical protein